MPALLWELAEEQKQKNKEKNTSEDQEDGDEGGSSEYTLLLLGCKSSGKSSLILRFLDRDEKPKPTIGLEYTYGRRSRGNNKQLAHIWELGGGTSLLNLAGVPISAKTVANVVIVLMLDLSQPATLWNTYEASIAAVKNAVGAAISKLPQPEQDHIRDATLKRLGLSEQDKKLDALPVPFVIIGGKFDGFQNFDPDKKRLICRTLRYMAHHHGAMLQFFSNQVETLVMRGRVTLSHLLFKTSASKGTAVDHTKPVFVAFGGDSLESIGTPEVSAGSISSGQAIEDWKNAFCSTFPQKEEEQKSSDDPAKDPQFKEEAIDLLRARKDEELKEFLTALKRTYMAANVEE